MNRITELKNPVYPVHPCQNCFCSFPGTLVAAMGRAVEAADYLVTWNCKHIGNALIRRRLGEINQSLALPTPIICTPEAMMGPGMIHDPIVKEVREAGQKLFEEAGGTMKGFCEMLRRKEKERKWPVFRRAARRSPKKK